MGSFAFTCVVSDLPIEHGDKVRYLLLSMNVYKEPAEWTCYVSGRWKLRSFPVRAAYNDYGSVEKFGQPLLQRLMFDSFNRDAVERGVGDNECHDVAVEKGMSEKRWLEAIWEGRVLVRESPWARPLTKEERRKYRSKVPVGIPTRRRVEKALKTGGLPISRGDFAKGLLVDRVKLGFIRVRAGGHGNEHLFPQAMEALSKKYAVMLTTGTGRHDVDSSELLVAAKPLADGKRYGAIIEGFRKKDPMGRRHIPICQAMVREDVWQVLIKQSLNTWEGTTITLDHYKADARVAWQKVSTLREKERNAKDLSPKEMSALFMERFKLRDDNKNAILSWVMSSTREEGGPGYGLRDAWEEVVEAEPKGAELDDFLDTVAETCFVMSVLSNLRFQWHQGTSTGPQFGEWRFHQKVLDQYAAIAKSIADEQDLERGEDV